MPEFLQESANKPYVAAQFVEPDDKVDHGVKGQKWGVRRSSAQLKAAKATRQASSGGSKPAASTPASKAASGEETSHARYARIAATAKAGQASSLSDNDLKFFNARTEALKKVNALNQKDTWLKDTAQEVLRNAAKQSMQQVANAAAGKYISKPIIDKLNAKPASAPAPAADSGSSES